MLFRPLGMLFVPFLCICLSVVVAQELSIPSNWNHTSALSRGSRQELANNAASELLLHVSLKGDDPNLPFAQYSTGAIAVLALQDYYSQNSTWYNAVNSSVQTWVDERRLYIVYTGDEKLNSDSIYWGLAFFYAYKAYKQKRFLDFAVEAYDLTYAGGYINSSAAVTGTGAGRNITFTPPPNCTNDTIAGGVFWEATPRDNTFINSETVSPFMALSAYLFEETGNSSYSDAAEMSLNFIHNHLWNGSIVTDGFTLATCSKGNGNALTYNQAWFIEGISVWANVTGDPGRVWTTFLENDIIPSVTHNGHYWTSPDNGIIYESGDVSNVEANLKGLFIRGLTEVCRRYPGTTLSQYLEGYITVQFNALMNNARAPGTNFYTTAWLGPYNSSFTAVGNIAALDVLNAAFLFGTPSTTSSSAHPTNSTVPHDGTTNTKKASNESGIIGGVVAGAVVSIVVAFAYVIWRRRRKHVTVFDPAHEQLGESDKTPGHGPAPIIEPFIHPGAAPVRPSKLQRMQAPFHTVHCTSSSSTALHAQGPAAPVAARYQDANPSLLVDVSDSTPVFKRPSLVHAETPIIRRSDNEGSEGGMASGSASPHEASALSGDDVQGVGAQQALTLADLPTLARHLYPLLQDQQAEHPPQYGS
ncbi:unnamed protein product [Peniophora sp. CBMAI 1063]|nr:unnamed protein product [Peniophora sp. CBMAI 1063]